MPRDRAPTERAIPQLGRRCKPRNAGGQSGIVGTRQGRPDDTRWSPAGAGFHGDPATLVTPAFRHPVQGWLMTNDE